MLAGHSSSAAAAAAVGNPTTRAGHPHLAAVAGNMCAGLAGSAATDSSNSSMAAAAAAAAAEVNHSRQQRQQMYNPQHGFNYATAEDWTAVGGTAAAGQESALLSQQQFVDTQQQQQQQQHDSTYLAARYKQQHSETAYDASPVDYTPPTTMYEQHTLAAAAAGFGKLSSGSSTRGKGCSAAAAAGGKPRGRSGPKSKFSPFIGVSQYKRTGRWEAHIWDSSSSTKGSTVTSKGGKGKQLHLGSFQTAIQAARAYDRAAILLRGPEAALNFPLEEYRDDPVLQELSQMTRQEMVLALRKTCDMELEAAALEAFHARIPAGAVHLLHNMTGLPLVTSDDGSTQATAAFDTDGTLIYPPTGGVDIVQYQQQQQQWQWQQQQGGNVNCVPISAMEFQLEITPQEQQWLQPQHAQRTQHGSMLTVSPAVAPPAMSAPLLPGQHSPSPSHLMAHHLTSAAAGFPPTVHHQSSPAAAHCPRFPSAPLPEALPPGSPFAGPTHQQQQQQEYSGARVAAGRRVGLLPHGSAPLPGGYSVAGISGPTSGPGYSSGPLPTPQPGQSPSVYYLKPQNSGLTADPPSLTLPGNPGPVIIYAYESPTAMDLARQQATAPLPRLTQPGLSPRPSRPGAQAVRPDSLALSGPVRAATRQPGTGPGFWPPGGLNQRKNGAEESSSSSSGASGGSSMNTSSSGDQHLQHSLHLFQQQHCLDSAAAAMPATANQSWGLHPAYRQQQQQQVAGAHVAVQQQHNYHAPSQHAAKFTCPAAAAAGIICTGGSSPYYANPNRCSASGSCPTAMDLQHRLPTSPGVASPQSFTFAPFLAAPHQRWVQSKHSSSAAVFADQDTAPQLVRGYLQGQQQQQQQQLSPQQGNTPPAHAAAAYNNTPTDGGAGNYPKHWHGHAAYQTTLLQQQQQQGYYNWVSSCRISAETAAGAAETKDKPSDKRPGSNRQHTPQLQAGAAAAAADSRAGNGIPAVVLTAGAATYPSSSGNMNPSAQPQPSHTIHLSITTAAAAELAVAAEGRHTNLSCMQHQYMQPAPVQQQQQQSPWLQARSQTIGWATLQQQQQQQQPTPLPAEVAHAPGGCCMESSILPEMRVGSLVSDDRNSGSNSAHSATTPPAVPIGFQSPVSMQLPSAASAADVALAAAGTGKEDGTWQQQQQQSRRQRQQQQQQCWLPDTTEQVTAAAAAAAADAAAADAALPLARLIPGPDAHWTQPQQHQLQPGNMHSTQEAKQLVSSTHTGAAAAAEAMLYQLADNAVNKATAAAAVDGARTTLPLQQQQQQQQAGASECAKPGNLHQPSSTSAAAAGGRAAAAAATLADEDAGSLVPIRAADQLSSMPHMSLRPTSTAAASRSHIMLNPELTQELEPSRFMAQAPRTGQGSGVEVSEGGESATAQLLPPSASHVKKVLRLEPGGQARDPDGQARRPDSQAGGPDDQARSPEGDTAVLLLRPSATPPASPISEPVAIAAVDTPATEVTFVRSQPDTAAAARVDSSVQQQQQQGSAKHPVAVSNSSPATSNALQVATTPILPALSGPLRSISNPVLVAELARLASFSGNEDFASSLGRVYREGSGLQGHRPGSGLGVFREGSGFELGLLLENQQLLYQQHSLPGLEQLDVLLMGVQGASGGEAGAAAAAAAGDGDGPQIRSGTIVSDATGCIATRVNPGGAQQAREHRCQGKSDEPAVAAAAAAEHDANMTAAAEATAGPTANVTASGDIAHTWATPAPVGVAAAPCSTQTAKQSEPSGVLANKRILKVVDPAVGAGHTAAAAAAAAAVSPVAKRSKSDTNVGHGLPPPPPPAAAGSSDSSGVAAAVGAAGAAAHKQMTPQPATLNAAWWQMMQD